MPQRSPDAATGGVPAPAGGSVPAGGSAAAPATVREPAPGRAYLVAAYGLLVVIGGLFGPLTAFLVPSGIGPIALGTVLVTVGNPALCWFGSRLTGTRSGAVAPFVVWVLTVMFLTVNRPEGDFLVTVPGQTRFTVFLVLGLFTAVIAIFLVRPVRGMTSLPPPRSRS